MANIKTVMSFYSDVSILLLSGLLKIIFECVYFHFPVPPTMSTLIPSKQNPLSEGDFVVLTCSTDSSNPVALPIFVTLSIDDFPRTNYTVSDGADNGQQVALSGLVKREHNGINVSCDVSYNNSYNMGLRKTFQLNVTCK